MYRLFLALFLFSALLQANKLREYDPLYKIENGSVFHFQKLGTNTVCDTAYIELPPKKSDNQTVRFMEYCKDLDIKNLVMAARLSLWHLEGFFKRGEKYMYNVVTDKTGKKQCIIHISSQYNLSEKMIEDGFAIPRFSGIPSDQTDLYLDALKHAKNLKSGLWSGYPALMQCMESYINPTLPEKQKKSESDTTQSP